MALQRCDSGAELYGCDEQYSVQPLSWPGRRLAFYRSSMFRHIFHCTHGRCIALAAGAVFSFTARRGERIVCRGGRVLLTQYAVAQDFDFSRGEEIVVQTHGLVVIEAIEASVLSLESVLGQKDLQQLIQIALAAQRWAYVLGRHFKQAFTLRRE